jgi:hypothetical protein
MDACEAVMELKAVSALTGEHVKQLEYYMHHFEIDTGYLINFPHITGFPEVPADASDTPRVFNQTVLQSDRHQCPLSDRIKRSDGKLDAQVSIIKLVRSPTGDGKFDARVSTHKLSIGGEDSYAELRATTQPPLPLVRDVAHMASVADSIQVWGITQKGKPCKKCISLQNFCRIHAPWK